MRLTWSHTILPFLAIFITLSLACEESKPGAGGSVTPGTEDPRILEAYVCGNVSNGNPEYVGTDFFPGETVYIWISWDTVPDKHEFYVLWTNPDDDVVKSPTQSFNSKTGEQITFASLNTPTTAPTGRWYVEVYLDDNFYASYSFMLWETR